MCVWELGKPPQQRGSSAAASAGAGNPKIRNGFKDPHVKVMSLRVIFQYIHGYESKNRSRKSSIHSRYLSSPR